MRMVLGVHREHPAGTDDDVIDVGVSVTNWHSVKEPPHRTEPGKLRGNGLFAVGTNTPSTLIRSCADESSKSVSQPPLRLALRKSLLSGGCPGLPAADVLPLRRRITASPNTADFRWLRLGGASSR